MLFFKTFENKIIWEILLLISFDVELSFKIALETGNVTRDFHLWNFFYCSYVLYICHIENRYMILVVIENYVKVEISLEITNNEKNNVLRKFSLFHPSRDTCFPYSSINFLISGF